MAFTILHADGVTPVDNVHPLECTYSTPGEVKFVCDGGPNEGTVDPLVLEDPVTEAFPAGLECSIDGGITWTTSPVFDSVFDTPVSALIRPVVALRYTHAQEVNGHWLCMPRVNVRAVYGGVHEVGGDTESPALTGTLLAENTVPGSIILSGLGATDNVAVDKFQYRFKVSGGAYGSWVDIEVDNETPSTMPSVGVDGFTLDTDYEFEVRVIDTSGNAVGTSATATANSGVEAPVTLFSGVSGGALPGAFTPVAIGTGIASLNGDGTAKLASLATNDKSGFWYNAPVTVSPGVFTAKTATAKVKATLIEAASISDLLVVGGPYGLYDAPARIGQRADGAIIFSYVDFGGTVQYWGGGWTGNTVSAYAGTVGAYYMVQIEFTATTFRFIILDENAGYLASSEWVAISNSRFSSTALNQANMVAGCGNLHLRTNITTTIFVKDFYVA